MTGWLAFAVTMVLSSGAGGAAPPAWRTLERADLQVTLGEIGTGAKGKLEVNSPKMRAVAPKVRSQAVALSFTYLGPTEQQAALRSGELRRQVGLKLRAQDGCNVVYVMWRFAPVAGVVVQTKSNPGVHRFAECGTAGYRTVRPSRVEKVDAPQVGERHVLAAEIVERRLRVSVDGRRVWEGELGPEAFAFDGPVGLRSDNARFAMELRARPSQPAR